MFLPEESLVCPKRVLGIFIPENLMDLYLIQSGGGGRWKSLNSVEENKSLDQMLHVVFYISTSSLWNSGTGRTERKNRTVIQSIN